MSMIYLNFVQEMIKDEQITKDSLPLRAFKVLMKSLSGYFEIIKFRKYNTYTPVQAFYIVTSLVVVLTTIHFGTIQLNKNIFESITKFVFIYLSFGCIFFPFTINKDIDIDVSILNKIVIILMVVFLIVVTDKIDLSNKRYEAIINAVFLLYSVKIIIKQLYINTLSVRNKYFKIINSMWVFGICYLVVKYFSNKTISIFFESENAIDIIVTLGLMTVFIIIGRQKPKQTEFSQFKKLLNSELTYGLYLVLVRGVMWKMQ